MFLDHEEVIECITLGGVFFFPGCGRGRFREEIFMGMIDGFLTLFEVHRA